MMAPHAPDVIRFSLLASFGHQSENRANWDFRPSDEMQRSLAWRIDPDDVRAYINCDGVVILIKGGSHWLEAVGRARAERRHAFQYVAGNLGEHILEQIEKAEGWP